MPCAISKMFFFCLYGGFSSSVVSFICLKSHPPFKQKISLHSTWTLCPLCCCFSICIEFKWIRKWRWAICESSCRPTPHHHNPPHLSQCPATLACIIPNTQTNARDRRDATSGWKLNKRGALSILAAKSNALYLTIWFPSFANEIIS
jgi:hypothetical protein